jgi:hypothetical protein
LFQNREVLWNKKIKAKDYSIIAEREDLKIKENQAEFRGFKARFEGNLVAILSFEVIAHAAWTRNDR